MKYNCSYLPNIYKANIKFNGKLKYYLHVMGRVVASYVIIANTKM